MSDSYKIKFETEGLEKAQEQIECLADAYDGFPAQVTVRDCHDCTINIYPSQNKFTEVHSGTIEPVEEEEPERKKGKWLPSGMDLYPYKCDQCEGNNDEKSCYCPICGADMRGNSDEN